MYSTFKGIQMENICNTTEFRIVSRVNKAVCPVYLEVRPLSNLSSHEKFRVEISKTGRDFMIWKFEEIEIATWVWIYNCFKGKLGSLSCISRS